MDNQQKQTTTETVPQRTENVQRWVTSPEGRDAIAASLQRAHTLAAQFREAERVKPESLNKPITR